MFPDPLTWTLVGRELGKSNWQDVMEHNMVKVFVFFLSRKLIATVHQEAVTAHLVQAATAGHCFEQWKGLTSPSLSVQPNPQWHVSTQGTRW